MSGLPEIRILFEPFGIVEQMSAVTSDFLVKEKFDNLKRHCDHIDIFFTLFLD